MQVLERPLLEKRACNLPPSGAGQGSSACQGDTCAIGFSRRGGGVGLLSSPLAQEEKHWVPSETPDPGGPHRGQESEERPVPPPTLHPLETLPAHQGRRVRLALGMGGETALSGCSESHRLSWKGEQASGGGCARRASSSTSPALGAPAWGALSGELAVFTCSLGPWAKKGKRKHLRLPLITPCPESPLSGPPLTSRSRRPACPHSTSSGLTWRVSNSTAPA